MNFKSSFECRGHIREATVEVSIEDAPISGYVTVSVRAAWAGSHGYAAKTVLSSTNIDDVLDAGLLNAAMTELEQDVAETVETYTQLVLTVAG